jgi:predicted HTH transcriptional regulator
MSRIVHGWRDLGHFLELKERFEPQEHTVLSLHWANATPLVPKSSPKSSPIPHQDTAESILLLLGKNPFMSTRVLGENLEISKRAVLKQIEKLKAQNRLRRVGSAKAGRWEVMSADSQDR